MTIRKTNKNDTPKIATLAKETYAKTFGDEMTEEDLAEALKARDENYFSDAIKSDEVLVAEFDDAIVGFIQFGTVTYKSIKTNPEDLELKKIYVNPNFHGQGIGKKLIEAMLSNEKNTSTSDIYLDVYAKNDQATGLYKKYGFKEVGKTPFIVGNKVLGYDVLMKRSNKTKSTYS